MITTATPLIERSRVLETGRQRCLSKLFPKACKLFRHPVFASCAVMSLINSSAKRSPEFDAENIVTDIALVTFRGTAEQRKVVSGYTTLIKLVIFKADLKPDEVIDDLPYYKLITHISPLEIDNRTPVFNISLWNNDLLLDFDRTLPKELRGIDW